MKPLSIRLLATAGVLAIAMTGFAPKPATSNASVNITTTPTTTTGLAPSTPAATAQAASAAQTHISAATLQWIVRQSYFHALRATAPLHSNWDMSYYWYTYPQDAYVDYKTVADEEWELWLALGGVEVDTNSIGGTLLEEGYLMYGWPHSYIYQFLYGHFLL